MGSGLDSPTTMSPDKDAVFAGLHQKLLNSAQNDPLRLAQATTDYSPAPPSGDNSGPGVRLAADGGPPPLQQTDARPARTVVAQTDTASTPTDLTGATPATGDARTASAPSTFAYKDAGTSADDPTICNWRPNPNSTSQLTKDWFAAHQSLASAPVDCNYTVKFGDDLGSIARRELKTENKATDSASVKAEIAKIIKLNDDHYKSLDCNSELIRKGWVLKLNDACTTPVADAPAAPAPAPIEAPPPAPAPVDGTDSCHTGCKGDEPAHVQPTNKPVAEHAKEHCAPCGADVVVDNPGGRTFLNGAEVGVHDRTIINGRQATEVPIPHGDGTRREHRSDAAPAPGPGQVVGDNTTSPTPKAAVADAKSPTDVPLPSTPAPELPAPLPVIKQASVERAPGAVTGDAGADDDLIPGPKAEVAPEIAPAPAPTKVASVQTPAPESKIAKPAGGDDLGDGANLGP